MNFPVVFLFTLALVSPALGAQRTLKTASAPAPGPSPLTSVPCPIANGTLRVGLWQGSEFPLLTVGATKPFTFSADATGASGFEWAIVQAFALLVNCKTITIVPVPDLPSRITYLQNGLVDFVISGFSVTPAREELVDFIRPFYYGSGAALFTTATNALTLTSWAGIKGLSICVKAGNYAIPTLSGTYGAKIVNNIDTADAVAKIASGACVAYLQDSTTVLAASTGLSQVTALKPILVSPYGIATAQGQDVLYMTLAAFSALLESFGPDSALAQFEAQFLVPNGVGPLATLNSTINAITNFA